MKLKWLRLLRKTHIDFENETDSEYIGRFLQDDGRILYDSDVRNKIMQVNARNYYKTIYNRKKNYS